METSRLLFSLVCAVACGSYQFAWAEEGIYSFVDAQGAIHLSNDPDDGRYQMLVAAPAAPSATGAATATLVKDETVRTGPWPQLRSVVLETAARYRIDAALLRAVITAESGYDPRAVSRKGAGGLMQLMPETARRLGVSDVFDPVENVRGGTRYLVELLHLFDNDLRLALAAYNAGEGAVMRYGRRVPPYRETRDYVDRVVRYYEQYRATM